MKKNEPLCADNPQSATSKAPNVATAIMPTPSDVQLEGWLSLVTEMLMESPIGPGRKRQLSEFRANYLAAKEEERKV